MIEATHDDICGKIDGLEVRFTASIDAVAIELKARGDEEAKTRAFLFGGAEGPGLAELVRQHERWIGVQRKILFAIAPAIFLGVAAVVWQAVSVHLAE